ncbi:MAG: antibiotic biosynthesis monooxygenase [Roseobacter sp.]
MYIAMNRFNVTEENAEAFETLWLGRDSHLKTMDGFVEFHMLKGTLSEEGVRLYASHTVWSSEDAFRQWTRSDAFRAAHKDARNSTKLHEGAPNFEGFTVIQEISAT